MGRKQTAKIIDIAQDTLFLLATQLTVKQSMALSRLSTIVISLFFSHADVFNSNLIYKCRVSRDENTYKFTPVSAAARNAWPKAMQPEYFNLGYNLLVLMRAMKRFPLAPHWWHMNVIGLHGTE